MKSRLPAWCRSGMTLMELIVVITIMSILMTLTAVFVVPAFQDNKSVQRGSDRLAGALLIAKQRAFRDQLPRGLRLLVDPSNNALVRQLQYIEQPEPFREGVCASADGTTVTFTFPGGDTSLIGAGTAGVQTTYMVQRGDFLRLFDGRVFPIDNVTGNAALQLASPATPWTTPQKYTIYRQARPIANEPLVDLPTGVVIYIASATTTGGSIQGSTYLTLNNNGTGYDVLFSPGGGVVGSAANTPVIFWVATEESVSLNQPNNAAVQLIVLQCGTGFIANQPLGGSANWYQFAQDGHSSGM